MKADKKMGRTKPKYKEHPAEHKGKKPKKKKPFKLYIPRREHTEAEYKRWLAEHKGRFKPTWTQPWREYTVGHYPTAKAAEQARISMEHKVKVGGLHHFMVMHEVSRLVIEDTRKGG